MVDLDFVEAGLGERSAPSAAGSNSLQASAGPGFTKDKSRARQLNYAPGIEAQARRENRQAMATQRFSIMTF